MLYELIKILTTAFLLFALCFFTWGSVGKRKTYLTYQVISFLHFLC